MKVKDLERTANIAWSPSNTHPILLATGTAAQQIDSTFNTTAALEIYALNLSEPGPDMELKYSVPTEQRFHKLVWGPYNSGTIVGGCDGGLIKVYNSAKLCRGENSFVSQQDKHSGPVHALDFNPFQGNLLATGAGESEIYIWDLNNMKTPMTPGVKSQPFEDILCVSWNRQVQHILASTFSSKCVVWDLRKNEPIIKLSDTVSRIRWKVVAWHPDIATQLCLASEEDQAPVVQLWDLRFATSPIKTLENHQRGILSIAWCAQDSNLLVSCGKDNRIVCWNPNSNNPGGEVLSEIAKTNEWNFDVAWCPRNPALIACPSYDGHISVYSLMGGKIPQVQTTNKIADSFPGMDGYVQAPTLQNAVPVSVDLSKAPKWLKRPARTSFGFGGKLLTFVNENLQANQQSTQTEQVVTPVIRTVFISQVITETELINQSAELEQALEYGNFIDYCSRKADTLSDPHKKNIWLYLKANFEHNPRAEILNLLGYKLDDANKKLEGYVGQEIKNDMDGLSDQFNQLNQCYDYSDGENNSSKGSADISPSSLDNSHSLLGIDQSIEVKKYKINTTEDNEGLITQALLLGNIEAAVELCLKAQRFADAIIIATTGGAELLAHAQLKYFQQSEGAVSPLISALVSEDWTSVVLNCDITSWKEALVAIVTHATDYDLPKLCELLGKRLEEEGTGNQQLVQNAQLCYICAGDFEKLVDSWSTSVKKSSNELQELVELITFLQKAVERQGRSVEITGSLADLLSYYASILASQGNLSTALTYLGSSKNEQVSSLRDRLTISLGHKPTPAPVQPRDRQTSFSSYLNQPIYTPPTPAYNQFSTGLPNPPVVNQQWQQPNYNPPPVPKTFSPPPIQPPRPTSVGSSHGGSGITSRAKYIVDPSVQSGGPYGTRNQYGAPQHSQPAYQNNPNMNNPYNIPSNVAGNPSIANNPMQFIPNANMPPPIEKSDMTPSPLLHGGGPSVSLPGWNDPPVYHKPPGRVQPKPDYSQPLEPITHPLYGAAPNMSPSNGYGEQPAPFSPTPQPNSPQIFHPPPPNNQQMYQQSAPPPSITQQPQSNLNFNTQSVSHGTFNQNAVNSNIQQQYQPQPTPPPEKAQQVMEKSPLLDDDKPIQNILDSLRNQCLCTAINPQTKRKLDDVGKKLEILYDLLRDQKLSPATVASLHQMAQFAQGGDYSSCLNLHTQLASGADFSQIAGFMPGIKVLLSSASQLQVYLQ